MALQKIEVPLVVSGGIDTKTDRKIVPDKKMIKTENVDFSKLGTLKKSKGTTRLTASTDTSDDISDISSSIFSHNNEIIVMGKQRTTDVYSYNSHDNEWKNKNDIDGEKMAVSCDINVDQNSADYLNCSCSSMWEFPLAGFKIFATIVRKGDSSTPFRITKVDYETGEEQIFEPDSTDSYELKVIGIDDASNPFFWVIVSQLSVSTYTDRVLIYTFDKDVSQQGSAINVAEDVTAFRHYPIFDGTIVDGALFFVAAVDKTDLEIGYITTAGSLTGASTYTVSNSVCINDDGSPFIPFNHPNITCFRINDRVFVAFVEYNLLGANRDIYAVGFSTSDLTTVKKTETKIVDKTVYGSIYYRIDLVSSPVQSDTDSLVLAASGYEISASGVGFVKTDLFSIGWISASPSVQIRTSSNSISNTEIASKAFSFFWPTEPDVLYYVMVSTVQGLENSTFNLVRVEINGTNDWDREIIGKFYESNAIDPWATEFNNFYDQNAFMGNLGSIIKGRDDKYYFACLVKADLINVGTSVSVGASYLIKNSSVSIDLDGESDSIVSTRLSQSTHLSGSVVREYDGSSVRFSGFSSSPKAILTTSAWTTHLTDGNHQYKLIYVYFDSNGESHRSDVSSTVDITTSSQSVVVTIGPVGSAEFNTERDSRSEVWIYRALTGTGGPFYLLAALPSDTSSYSDSWVSDSALLERETLYTDGGILSNSQVPSMSYIASGLHRIFGVSVEDKNKIYYSQKRIVENSIEWNLALYFRVDGHGRNVGEAVGVENLDDKMIIFKQDSLLYIGGDGPLPTGAQNTFTDPVVVSQEIGCNEAKSIVATPIGVMFKGKKGIYIVDRSLAVKYIGASVEEYNSETINGAEVSKVRNEVYFQTDNRLMVYNYLQDKWSTNTYLGGKSICIWQDQLACLKSDGLVYYQDELVYTDNLADISMKVATPWYKLKGTTGYGRLYEIIVYGEYKSDHTLNIRVYYDYDETDYGDYTFDVETMNIYEFSVKPSKQKCQSFKIEIWDTPTGGSGESYELTGISVRIGAKQGFYKLSDTNKG